MGRKEGDSLQASQIFYPCMQCADIFFLKADVCQLGMDQRKVNMLAREYAEAIAMKQKPVIVSHHMMMGLKEGQEKMSKSDPNSAIFMEDDPEIVEDKMRKAFCPPGVVEGNPVLDYAKQIVFERFGELKIVKQNDEKTEMVFKTPDELFLAYKENEVTPQELKQAVTKSINECLEPVREHFRKDDYAKQLLELVRSWRK